MFLKKHLQAFNIYLIFIILLTLFNIRGIPDFPIINYISYLFFHILIIYISIYHFRTLIYFICFSLGLIFDIFLFNEIGPHLITFMLLIIIIRLIYKNILMISSYKIIILIIMLLSLSYFLESCISYFLFDLEFKIYNFFQKIFVSIIICIPSFYIFNKIDKIG